MSSIESITAYMRRKKKQADINGKTEKRKREKDEKKKADKKAKADKEKDKPKSYARSGPDSKCTKHPDSNHKWKECKLNPSNPKFDQKKADEFYERKRAREGRGDRDDRRGRRYNNNYDANRDSRRESHYHGDHDHHPAPYGDHVDWNRDVPSHLPPRVSSTNPPPQSYYNYANYGTPGGGPRFR